MPPGALHSALVPCPGFAGSATRRFAQRMVPAAHVAGNHDFGSFRLAAETQGGGPLLGNSPISVKSEGAGSASSLGFFTGDWG